MPEVTHPILPSPLLNPCPPGVPSRVEERSEEVAPRESSRPLPPITEMGNTVVKSPLSNQRPSRSLGQGDSADRNGGPGLSASPGEWTDGMGIEPRTLFTPKPPQVVHLNDDGIDTCCPSGAIARSSDNKKDSSSFRSSMRSIYCFCVVLFKTIFSPLLCISDLIQKRRKGCSWEEISQSSPGFRPVGPLPSSMSRGPSTDRDIFDRLADT